MGETHQILPSSGPAREALREKGQFWTPDWVADAMVAYAVGAGADHIFDPAVGAGAFFAAARRVSNRLGHSIRLFGTEVDPSVIRESPDSILHEGDLSGIEIRDFVLDSPSNRFSAIVGNPPYIRHHRLDATTKVSLQAIAKRTIGKKLDGRTGYHVYFLIKALETLSPGGRLAFIMSADTCEGVFAQTLWKWILENFRLDAVIRFSEEASPFPNVDTNPLIFMISAAPPDDSFTWCICGESGSTALRDWVELKFPLLNSRPISAIKRQISEGLETGLSRPPRTRHEGPVLGDFIYSMRGIATGANDFFFMTKEEVLGKQLPLNLMIRAVGRTRDIHGCELSEDHLEVLDRENRPTYLLSLDGRSIAEFPETVRIYLRDGEKRQICDKALIQQRRPWYKMETRQVPPFLFAYLGRRSARFIRNRAGAVPLTSFLCVYPRRPDADFVEGVWTLLCHPDTIANLNHVAKSYGSGAIKVEPRALERVPISKASLVESGLNSVMLEHQAELALY